MGFYFRLTGRPAAWVVSITFMLIGALVALFLPIIVQPGEDRETAISLLHILGGIFFGLGALGLVWMLGDLYLLFTNPERRERWFWWGNFGLSFLAAALFAVPATLVFPFFCLAFIVRPNALFPPYEDPSKNLLLGLIFSIVGALCLVFMFYLGRATYRDRPR